MAAQCCAREANGFDVLDIDLAGRDWWDAHRAELPATQTHVTRSGGAHLLFKHAEGLRCSVGRIAAGVGVRADGGFVVWWPRQGLRSIEGALGEWPEWLLEQARKPELVGPVDKGPCKRSAAYGAASGGVTANMSMPPSVLLEMTPSQFRAAKELLPYEQPKLTAVAIGHMDQSSFAAALERAIIRSKSPPPPAALPAPPTQQPPLDHSKPFTSFPRRNFR